MKNRKGGVKDKSKDSEAKEDKKVRWVSNHQRQVG